jgi:SAM-dependent methyltransferase
MELKKYFKDFEPLSNWNEEDLKNEFFDRIKKFIEEFTTKLKPQIKYEENVIYGKSDARINQLVFEFKSPFTLQSESEKRKSQNQVKEKYVKGYKERGIRCRYVITDGVWIGFLDENGRFLTNYGELAGDLQFYDFKDGIRYLQTLLEACIYVELSSENILKWFGPGKDICSNFMQTVWKNLDLSNDKINDLYQQWRTLFSESTSRITTSKNVLEHIKEVYGIDIKKGKNKEEEIRKFIFTLHTYYVIILKLLACRILDETGFVPTSLIKSIITSSIKGFKDAEKNISLYVTNFVDADPFVWIYTITTNEFTNVIREMAEIISNYDISEIRRDVLKKVYQEIIPPALRKSLGEFYTKDWVAEDVLDALEYSGEGKILDPACGSGTFLVLAIRRIKKKYSQLEDSELLKKIIDSVVGFDLNPLAVLMSRLNYLLQIKDLLHSVPAGYTKIPVYLCDSIVFPEVSSDTMGMKRYMLPVAASTEEIAIPAEGDPILLLDTLKKVIKEDPNYPLENFLEETEREFGKEYLLKYELTIKKLFNWIKQLEKEGKNGLWCSLIENFFAPLFYKNSFDFIVGNPPWVCPERIPEKYRRDLRKLLQKSKFMEFYRPRLSRVKLFAGSEKQYSACIPFFERAFNHFLKPRGKLAFLVTSSLLKSLNAGGFRKQMMRLKPIKILDYTLFTKIHEGATCWAMVPVILNENGSDDDEIEYVYYTSPNLSETNKPYVKWKIKKKDLLVVPKDEDSPWFTAPPEIIEIFKKMMQFPRIGDLYPIWMGIKTGADTVFEVNIISQTDDPNLVLVRNITSANPRARKLAEHPFKIEKQLLRKVIKAENIDEFGVNGYSYFIWPVTFKIKGGEKVPVIYSKEEMKKSFPRAFEYFTSPVVMEMLKSRTDYKGGPVWTIFRLSKKKFQPVKVFFHHMTPLLTAVCVTDDTLLPHTGAYFIALDNKDVGYYISGIMNSSILRSFAYSFAPVKGKTKQYVGWTVGLLPLPPYNFKNSIHKKISDLSQNLHENYEKLEKKELNEKLEELNKLVAKVYNLNENEAKRLEDWLKVAQGKNFVR